MKTGLEPGGNLPSKPSFHYPKRLKHETELGHNDLFLKFDHSQGRNCLENTSSYGASVAVGFSPQTG